MEIPYNSEEALKLAEKVMEFISKKAQEASTALAQERGSFGNFKGSSWDKKGIQCMRNATVTTIAPNGTTSLVANVNGGIEPVFALAYVRRNMETVGEDTELIMLNGLLEKKLKEEWLYSKEIMERIAKEGTLSNIDKVPEKLKKIFVTSYDIDSEWHIRMQGAFQKHTDNAVSKTINLSENATKNDIKNVFMLAVRENLKGLTIYRDKSRDKQVLNLK